jgi:hypothetical protein
MRSAVMENRLARRRRWSNAPRNHLSLSRDRSASLGLSVRGQTRRWWTGLCCSWFIVHALFTHSSRNGFFEKSNTLIWNLDWLFAACVVLWQTGLKNLSLCCPGRLDYRAHSYEMCSSFIITPGPPYDFSLAAQAQSRMKIIFSLP